jgi:hypothetical protein
MRLASLSDMPPEVVYYDSSQHRRPRRGHEYSFALIVVYMNILGSQSRRAHITMENQLSGAY